MIAATISGGHHATAMRTSSSFPATTLNGRGHLVRRTVYVAKIQLWLGEFQLQQHRITVLTGHEIDARI
jgi:hypothetical protein